MLLVSYIQQYSNTSITVLTNQVWKLLIALFKVPNTGAFTVCPNFKSFSSSTMYKIDFPWESQLFVRNPYCLLCLELSHFRCNIFPSSPTPTKKTNQQQNSHYSNPCYSSLQYHFLCTCTSIYHTNTQLHNPFEPPTHCMTYIGPVRRGGGGGWDGYDCTPFGSEGFFFFFLAFCTLLVPFPKSFVQLQCGKAITVNSA